MASSSSTSLRTYRQKRNARQTPEPFGHGASSPGLYVFQKHAASHLHFDLRLEVDGTLKSWAVPKGPSLDPSVKRAAFRVEDHPIEYGGFEGHIPEGNYGAGSVIVWDRGVWLPDGDPATALEAGKLTFELRGEKLQGRWALVRMKRNPKEWLLIKHKDRWAGADRELEPQSVLSGLTVEEVCEGVDKREALRERIEALGAPRGRLPTSALSPMLCETRRLPFSDSKWVFEFKYDGYRLLSRRNDGGVKLFFRSGAEVTDVFPDLVASLGGLPFEDWVIDGEVVVLDDAGQASFELLQKRAQKRRLRDVESASLSLPATYFAFDLLAAEGFDLRALPLLERKRLLKEVVSPVGPVLYSPHIAEHGQALWAQVEAQSLEGMVAKRADSKYRSGRSPAWVKVPRQLRGDFAVVGFTEPEQSREGLGALLVATYDGKDFILAGRVGTGFDDEALTRIRALLQSDVVAKKTARGSVASGRKPLWVTPKQVVEVRFKNWTSDGRLRQPAFVRFRPDKSPDACVRENDSV